MHDRLVRERIPLQIPQLGAQRRYLIALGVQLNLQPAKSLAQLRSPIFSTCLIHGPYFTVFEGDSREKLASRDVLRIE
jgi:hypothetical protein